jgi:hypothetical protein
MALRIERKTIAASLTSFRKSQQSWKGNDSGTDF